MTLNQQMSRYMSQPQDSVIQRKDCMRGVLLSSVACLPLPNFSHYLINATTYGEEGYGT